MEFREAKIKAEGAIAAALKAFEIDTGTVVRGVHIRDIDVTMMEDTTKRVVRDVFIEAEYLPGTSWNQAK